MPRPLHTDRPQALRGAHSNSSPAPRISILLGFGVIEAVGGLLCRTRVFKVLRYCCCCLSNFSKERACHEALLA